jgi:cytochrome c peroxidase
MPRPFTLRAPDDHGPAKAAAAAARCARAACDARARPGSAAAGALRHAVPAAIRALAAFALSVPLVAVAGEPTLRELARARFGSPTSLPAPAAPADGAPERLGRALFFDTRLGSDGRTGCVSCHLPGQHGADGVARSRDARGRLTDRNSPTVFDAAALPALRWRGDRRDAAHQAEDSIVGSMGHDSTAAFEARLLALGYGPAFAAAFPAASATPRAADFGRALQAYQRTLATSSAFGRWLAGEDGALAARQQRGLAAFLGRGCAGCHDGPQLGGRQFRKFGLTRDYWLATGSTSRDPGRYALTRDEADRNVFRVPMLRHVARTAPYFHDGSVPSLREAVRIMGTLQLDLALPGDELDAIVDFLGALDGPVPQHFSPPDTVRATPGAAAR